MSTASFDLDAFVDTCRAALAEADARRAIGEVVGRAVRSPSAVADALHPSEGGMSVLHHSADLTVLHLVWPPGMRVHPHDHRMWAAIGIYIGQEDNAFYRRAGDGGAGLEPTGGKQLRAGEVALLGRTTIHAVTNPTRSLTAAIHVYGGDFVNEPRSQWGPGALVERPYTITETRQLFADANRAWRQALEG